MAWLVDTNVISEARKGSNCDPHVADWLARQAGELHYISAISMMEVKLGIELAQNRNPEFAAVLEAWYETKLKARFQGKVLQVDLEVAEVCARLHAVRTRSFRDSLIGATALLHDLRLVTRNVKDFQGMGVSLVNPWTASPQ